jgi:type VI secretion system secreted protein Hcp
MTGLAASRVASADERQLIWQDSRSAFRSSEDIIDWSGDGMAAVDFFLKFDGIKGESTDAKHKDEIDVESWSWGETHAAAGPGGGGGAGKVAMQDFHFTMRQNTASVGLMRACATGEHIKGATLTGRKAGKDQQEYLTFKFHDVLVSSFQTGGTEDSALVPTDQVSFNFAKLEVEYKPEKADGSLGSVVEFRYDLKTNKTF